jgi:hypothetical protein
MRPNAGATSFVSTAANPPVASDRCCRFRIEQAVPGGGQLSRVDPIHGHVGPHQRSDRLVELAQDVGTEPPDRPHVVVGPLAEEQQSLAAGADPLDGGGQRLKDVSQRSNANGAFEVVRVHAPVQRPEARDSGLHLLVALDVADGSLDPLNRSMAASSSALSVVKSSVADASPPGDKNFSRSRGVRPHPIMNFS